MRMAAAHAQVRRQQKVEADSREASRLLNNFCSSPNMFNLGRNTCSRAVGKVLIEHGLTLAQGYGYYAKVKSLGCGVYHITYEEVK